MSPGSIRSQILLAFLAMSLLTAALGFSAVHDLERGGILLDRTYDRSLMSINFARAALADFNGMQAIAARRALAQDASVRAKYDAQLADYKSTMDDDLSVAVERAQSTRVIEAAKKVQAAVQRWADLCRKIAAGPDQGTLWSDLDRQAAVVGQQLDLLINYTAGDGFTYRQAAHGTVQSDRRLNIIATMLAVVLSATIAYLLARRVLLPIRQASEIASKIAEGDLDVAVPAGKADELGRLLGAMEVMRQNIKASMDREIELRRSAQVRLAEALEVAREGIVVVDGEGRIALGNAQASRLLDLAADPLAAGDTASRLLSPLGLTTADTEPLRESHEVEVAPGRWLHVSQGCTHDGGSIYLFSDISLLKSQQAALKDANFWLDAALDNLNDGLCLFDSRNELRVFNRRLCELFSFTAEQAKACKTAKDLAILAGPPDGESLADTLDLLERRIGGRRPVDGLLGKVKGRTLAISHRPLADGCWMATYEDVTERLQAAEKIAYMARHDALTGLPNRAFFAERIESALGGTARGENFALLCLDLDHFKEVNDTLGHPLGDELLRAVAGRLRAAVRDHDTVARLGGDEFAILQTRVEQAEDVRALAQRIIASLNAPCDIEGNPVPVGVSIGIALAPTDGLSYDKLLKSADLALYRAKADGRNGFRFFERAMDERQQARRLIELDLRDALATNQFEVDYQPVYDVQEARIVGFEALVRWRHPVRGIVPPSEFVPIAEEMGFITQLGDWVLRRACADAASWPGDVSVAVNVSAAQLRHYSLHETVIGALEESGLAPGRLVLEITETVLIANPQNALLVLDRFREMGIRIAMDDFGTGYSSLSYLRSFPFDHVKIDKSFIMEITTRLEAAAIVRAVIALCRSLGMRTIAEGIESEDQLAFIRAEGCNEAQGFYFSKPLSVERIPALLETQTKIAKFFAGIKAA